MKKLFFEGEQVICIDKECKPIREAGACAPNIVYDRPYVIDKYLEFAHGVWWVSLKGFIQGSRYSEDSFGRMLRNHEIMALMADIDLKEQVHHI
jgi:hypothetical protein